MISRTIFRIHEYYMICWTIFQNLHFFGIPNYFTAEKKKNIKEKMWNEKNRGTCAGPNGHARGEWEVRVSTPSRRAGRKKGGPRWAFVILIIGLVVLSTNFLDWLGFGVFSSFSACNITYFLFYNIDCFLVLELHILAQPVSLYFSTFWLFLFFPVFILFFYLFYYFIFILSYINLIFIH